jgi:hypothetical protein
MIGGDILSGQSCDACKRPRHARMKSTESPLPPPLRGLCNFMRAPGSARVIQSERSLDGTTPLARRSKRDTLPRHGVPADGPW